MTHSADDRTGEESEPRLGRGELVLVVEDNEKNARLTIDMLTAAGYRTRLATDGHEGELLAAETHPDLIITDLQMPRVDGLAMTRALRQRAETKCTPIIVVSAHALNEHRQDAFSAGCCGFLTKPFRYRDLLCEVAAALDHTSTIT